MCHLMVSWPDTLDNSLMAVSMLNRKFLHLQAKKKKKGWGR